MKNRLTLGDRETTKANKLMDELFALATETEQAERDARLQRLLHSIAAVEQMLDKPTHAVTMNVREKRGYEEKCSEIDIKIEESKQAVVAEKARLVDARANRRQQEEYDALAAVALELPSRAKSNSDIEKLHENLSRLHNELDSLDAKFNLRKRQFQLLIYKLHDIRLILKGDGELGDIENAKSDGDDVDGDVKVSEEDSTDTTATADHRSAKRPRHERMPGIVNAAPAETVDAPDSASPTETTADKETSVEEKSSEAPPAVDDVDEKSSAAKEGEDDIARPESKSSETAEMEVV